MNTEEYRIRFVAQITSRGIGPETASDEHAAWIEMDPEAPKGGAPELDADEALSYYAD